MAACSYKFHTENSFNRQKGVVDDRNGTVCDISQVDRIESNRDIYHKVKSVFFVK